MSSSGTHPVSYHSRVETVLLSQSWKSPYFVHKLHRGPPVPRVLEPFLSVHLAVCRLNHRSIYSFGYSVHFRGIGRSDFMSDPSYGQPIFKLLAAKFASSVRSKDLSFLSSLSFHFGIEFLKDLLHPRLALQQLDFTETREIILKGHKETCSAWCAYMERTTHSDTSEWTISPTVVPLVRVDGKELRGIFPRRHPRQWVER